MGVAGRDSACLLDTHVLYWMQAEPERLSRRARVAIEAAQAQGELSISVFTLYELSQMVERGRIQSQGTVRESVRMLVEDIPVRPITLEIISVAVSLPAEVPRDPGDRLIAATAIVDALLLITADEKIRSSKAVRTIW